MSLKQILVREVAVLLAWSGVVTGIISFWDIGPTIQISLILGSAFIYVLQYLSLGAAWGRESSDGVLIESLLTPLPCFLRAIRASSQLKTQELTSEVNRLRSRATRRKSRMARLVRDFRNSLSALPDAIVALDRNNRIEWWNKAAGDLIGLEQPADLKKRIEVFFGTGEFQRYLLTQEAVEPLEIRAIAHPEKLLSIRVTPFGEDQRLLQGQDITLMKQLERVRQEFIANASHELRTPMTVVHGYLETLIDEQISEPVQMKAALKQMYYQTTRIKGIIEDMLTLAQLEKGQTLRKEAVDVEWLISRVREEALSLGLEKGHKISIRADEGFFILWNPEELHSLFSNLVTNAVKYTPVGGQIDLGWSVGTLDARFTVSDTGIGIEKSHISRLTERFYRVDVARSRESGGTGLGLAIVKHVLGRMGGELQISSDPGVGSCFTCVLPLHILQKFPEKEKKASVS